MSAKGTDAPAELQPGPWDSVNARARIRFRVRVRSGPGAKARASVVLHLG